MVFQIINSNDVFSFELSHQRCDGTFNSLIRLQDGTELDVYNLCHKAAKGLEYNLTHPDMCVKLDIRYLVQTEDQWLRQNGIKVA